MRKLTFSFFVAASLLFGLQGSADAQTVTYLPAPPNSWTYPSDINNNGEAIGYSFSRTTHKCSAIRWVDGELSLLEGFDSSFASGINDAGVISGIGYRDTEALVNGEETPVIWVDGVPQELPTLGFGGCAYDVNSVGDVVGSVRNSPGGGVEPALWRDGELIVLDTPEGNGGFATTIDDAGLISGVCYAQNGGDFLPTQWSGGTPQVLPVTFGQNYVGSLGVNKTGAGRTSGYVIESRLLEDGQPYLVVVAVGWNSEGFRVLPRLDDNQSSWACDVNEQGVYAGYSRDSFGADVPVLWTEEGITRLPFAPGRTARAVALNETGLVIGNDTTEFSVPVIWNMNDVGQLGMSSARGARGSLVPLTVRAKDGNAPVAGQQVNFSVNGTIVGTATTNRSGVARMMYRIPNVASGKIGVAASMNGMPTIVRAVEVDTLRSSAGVSGTFDEETGKVQLTASVNAIEPNKPVANGRVNFFMNGRRIASATTDSRGIARAEVAVPANVQDGTANIEARFTGDKLNRPITGRSSVGIDR